MRPGSLFFRSSLLFSSFFFFVDRAQPETLQWRGYLSVPVQHSIRTDGSSVIKMALRYNGEGEDARVCPRLCFYCRHDDLDDKRALYRDRPFPTDGETDLLITTAMISIARRCSLSNNNSVDVWQRKHDWKRKKTNTNLYQLFSTIVSFATDEQT